jgi:endonuclease YncB( thermonuclease family)
MSIIDNTPGILVVILIALVAFGFLRGTSGKPQTFSARAYVIDGDTLAFGDTRVRIFGIDAPEIAQSQGHVAKSQLLDMVRGQTLTVKPRTRDHYGRVVAKVALPDGTDIGAAMVSQGYALAYTRYGRDYARAERKARRSRTGLWAIGGIENGARYRAAN